MALAGAFLGRSHLAAPGPRAGSTERETVMADLAFFLLTLALFALVIAIARGADRL